MHLEGYFVKGFTKSGLTIATGYDLRYGANIKACLDDDELSKKLLPYRKFENEEDFKKACLPNLELSLSEAKKIDNCVLKFNKE